MKLKPWPNAKGYTYGNWDIMQNEETGVWYASYTPNGGTMATKTGHGDNWFDAIMHAKEIKEEN